MSLARLGQHAARRSIASTSARTMSTSFPSYIVDAPATETSKLSNGMRVASEGGNGETATIGVFIDAGSRDDAVSGVAHYMEHLAFKGTTKRTQEQLEEEVENMGAQLHAYTSREQTVYYAKVFKEDVPRATEILSDILFNSTFSKDAVERERSVILRESKEIAGDDYETVLDHLHEAAFLDTGLGRTILGPEENIRKITREDILAHVRTNYVAPRIVLAGAGAVDHKQLVELGAKHFGNVPSGAGSKRSPAPFTGSDVRIRDDSKKDVAVAIAFNTPGATSAQSIAVQVMASILGSWDRSTAAGKVSSSRLCNTVAEEGLAHSISSLNTQYQDSGLVGIYAQAAPDTLEDLMFVTMENLVRLCHTVTDEEVDRAKTALKAQLLGHLDDTTAICEDIGRSTLMLGRRMSPAELYARIDAVDTNTVKGVASKCISDQDFALAAIGNIHELPDYNWLRRRTYWVRY